MAHLYQTSLSMEELWDMVGMFFYNISLSGMH